MLNPGILLPPTEPDGKQVFVNAPNTTGYNTWFCGAGDDPSPTPPASGRGTGTRLLLAWDDVEARGQKTVDISFIEPVELHDGQVFYGSGGVIGGWTTDDTFSFSAVMPATVVTANATTEGNCNLVDAGGYNVIVPAAGDGTHDVDLSAAVPVPAGLDQQGYWDVDRRTGAVTASASPGAAEWHLLDVPVESYFLRSLPLGNPRGVFDIDTYKAEWVSERWQLRLTVDKQSAGAGEITGWLMLFRESTT